MNCRVYRSGLIEWGRGRVPREAARQVLVAHLERCEECARFLEKQRALSVVMADLAAEPIPSGDEFFGAVMTEFDRVHSSRASSTAAIRWGLAIGLAAAILVAVIATSRHAPRQEATRRATAPAAMAQPNRAPALASTIGSTSVSRTAPAHQITTRETAAEPEPPFYPIPYSTPLAPEEWTRVERMKIPVAALIAAGFRLIVPDPDAAVEADVLVSQDGRAHAIRPISILSSN